MNVDEHNRIPTTDGRLLRRIIRDARTRGNSARETIARWESVRRGEDKKYFPLPGGRRTVRCSTPRWSTKLAVLKQYAEPLLFGIPKDVPEYAEAKTASQSFWIISWGSAARNIPHKLDDTGVCGRELLQSVRWGMEYLLFH